MTLILAFTKEKMKNDYVLIISLYPMFIVL